MAYLTDFLYETPKVVGYFKIPSTSNCLYKVVAVCYRVYNSLFNYHKGLVVVLSNLFITSCLVIMLLVHPRSKLNIVYDFPYQHVKLRQLHYLLTLS